MDHVRGSWVDDSRLTEETHSNLTFRMKVVILVEIGIPSLWLKNFDEQSNSEWLQVNLDSLEEI